MKRLTFTMVVLMVIALVLTGCSQATPSSQTTTQTSTQTTSQTSTTTTTSASTKTTSQPSTTTVAPTSTTTTQTTGPQPVKGGVLRFIRSYGPSAFGTPPNMDGFLKFLNTERLVDWGTKGEYVPQLATSWESDPVNNTLTFHLQKGVKFTDGTDFNAQAAKWNMQRLIDNKLQIESDKIKSIEVVDDYTVKMYLTKLTSQAIINYGWVHMWSPTSVEKNGEEWAKTNQVGGGPFIMADWARDNYVNLTRNNNYWRGAQYPYLDGLKMVVIPDPMTASAMIQSGGADMWIEPPIQNMLELQKKGYQINWGPGYFNALFANSTDTNSKFANKAVREALEYAINRPAMAKALGYGTYEAFTQAAPKGSSGYIENYDPRSYNPEKAKELLAQAGYANGFKTTLMCNAGNQDAAAAIQAFLKEVKIDVTLDIADTGRYYTTFMNGYFGGEAFKDLAIGFVGIDLPLVTGLLRHFGPNPMTGILAINGAKTPEFLALCEKAYTTFNDADLTTVTQQMVKQISDDALVVPLYKAPYGTVLQPYVHSMYENEYHGVVWWPYLDWMEKH
jgi:peptide/nickel transport system substrate-binding protein